MPATFRTCEVVQYMEYMDCDYPKVIERIKRIPDLATYAVVLHDKDKKEDGTLKPPHFHAVLTFKAKNPKTAKTIASEIGIEPQYVNKIKTTTKSAQLYLTHKNAPDKYQYDANAVESSFDYAELVACYDAQKPQKKRSEVAEGIANGLIKRYNIGDFVNVDDYAKNKVYYDRCFEYRQKLLKGIDRNMDVIFICGLAGVGKTTFAKQYAIKEGMKVYISSGGKNPLDDYEGQECIILDDCRPDTFYLADFLKLTDNNTDSLVGCRFYNKSIAECKTIIITTTIDAINWFRDDNSAIEDRAQFYRRIKFFVDMTEDSITFHQWVGGENFVKVNSMINPIAGLRKKEKCEDMIRRFMQAITPEGETVPEIHLTDEQFEEVKNSDELPF